jgi:beta-mannosidase
MLPPNASTRIGEISVARWREVGENVSGVFAMLLSSGRPVAQNRVFAVRFKDLEFTDPKISIERFEDYAVFSSPGFVWGVCLDPNGEEPLSDDLFDLLPGVDYWIKWPADRALPVVKRCASPIRRV